jgi:hypothetical protein
VPSEPRHWEHIMALCGMPLKQYDLFSSWGVKKRARPEGHSTKQWATLFTNVKKDKNKTKELFHPKGDGDLTNAICEPETDHETRETFLNFFRTKGIIGTSCKIWIEVGCISVSILLLDFNNYTVVTSNTPKYSGVKMYHVSHGPGKALRRASERAW